jgi:fatty-acyl-CoA synthase
MLPSYGMAEATLAISFIGLDEVVTANVVDAAAFQERGAAVEATDPDAAVLQHVSCGRPFPGHEVAAFSDDGVRLPEGREGELRLRGPSVAAGYFGNPEATAATFLPDGWLRTGDLGYLLNGNVYVTGRLKDLIILNGRNLHPQAVEWSAAEVEGVRKGNVVAFSVPGASSEQLVVVLETRETDHARIATEVRSIVSREHGATVSDVVCIAPGQLPKTSSGKLQRRQTRQNYLEGRLGSDGSRDMRSTGDKLTLARHVAKSVWTRARTAVLG